MYENKLWEFKVSLAINLEKLSNLLWLLTLSWVKFQ